MNELAVATNEIGTAYMTVGATVVSFPTPTSPSNQSVNAQKTILPRHALVTVEGGDIRYKANGEDPTDDFGILVKNGSSIDWTNPLYSYQGFIQRCRIVALAGATVSLNISWRD